MTLPEFLEIKQLAEGAVSIVVMTGSMFCITGTDGQHYYLAFFVESNEYIKQCLEKVCRALDSVSPYAKYRFLTMDSYKKIGGGTPIDAIRSGGVNEVLESSKSMFLPD